MLNIASPAFQPDMLMPEKYTCRGENVSPPLRWELPPEGTRSLALIAEDVDSANGPFTHWIAWNIPPRITTLPEQLEKSGQVANGIKQGMNDFLGVGYGGPCPHEGVHRYYFRIYALDTELPLNGDVGKTQLLQAMEGHVLDEGACLARFAASVHGE